MQDQPVVRIAAEGLGDDLLKPGLDLVDGLAGREPGPVADPEDVGVDREGFLAERGVEDDIGGLAPDAGKGLQLLAGSWDLAAMTVDERLAQGDDVLRLGVEKANRLDCVSKIVLAKIDHLLRRLDVLEEWTAGDVDADVRRLGGQYDGDQQLVGIGRFELGRRRRIRLGQPTEEFENLVAGHAQFPWAMTSRIE